MESNNVTGYEKRDLILSIKKNFDLEENQSKMPVQTDKIKFNDFFAKRTDVHLQEMKYISKSYT